MTKKIIAKIISMIFGPVTWSIIILAVFMLRGGLNSLQLKILLPLIAIFQVVVPFSYILILFKRKKVTDLDLTKREERYGPLIVFVICLLITIFCIYLVGADMLFRLYLIILTLLIINALITIFWKISFHVGVITIGVIMINFLYYWQWPILYLTIPLVFWARLELKKHTVGQLLGGLILNAVIILWLLQPL